MTEVRFCAYCDQPVGEIPEGKVFTAGGDGDRKPYKHLSSSAQGVANCGRQFLAEHETYTESD